MGNLCAGPKDEENDRANLYAAGISTGSYGGGRARQLSSAARGGRATSFVGGSAPPRVHKATPNLLKQGTIEFGVEQRSIPLKDVSDELLLAELEHRNIRLHEHVTEQVVQTRYKFGKLLGQGASASVYEGQHKRTKKEARLAHPSPPGARRNRPTAPKSV